MTQETTNLPWTESPFFERELETSSLSQEDKAFVNSFANNGFVVFDTGIDVTLIDALNERWRQTCCTGAKGSIHRVHQG